MPNRVEKQGYTAGDRAAETLPHRIMEIRSGKGGEKCVYLSKTERIVKYSDATVILRVGKENVIYEGKELHIAAYHGGTVELCGIIDTITFVGGRNV